MGSENMCVAAWIVLPFTWSSRSSRLEHSVSNAFLYYLMNSSNPISLKGLQHTSVIELLAFMRLNQHFREGQSAL